MDSHSSKQSIRKDVRKQRQALTPEFITASAHQCADSIIKSNFLNDKKNIAFYLSNDNELDLSILIQYCLDHNKNCYLPVLVSDDHMVFIKYSDNTKLVSNKYNIAEPVAKHESSFIQPEQLDLVFLPLVAFTKKGQRLGMGGGFYDRTFAFLNNSTNNIQYREIKLIGIAYNFQCVDALPNEEWDIDLHGVATENQFIEFQPN